MKLRKASGAKKIVRAVPTLSSLAPKERPFRFNKGRYGYSSSEEVLMPSRIVQELKIDDLTEQVVAMKTEIKDLQKMVDAMSKTIQDLKKHVEAKI
jgi:predicted RNase H-like nuclease (RuvC/YqgF family)